MSRHIAGAQVIERLLSCHYSRARATGVHQIDTCTGVNQRDRRKGATALSAAAATNNVGAVRRLLAFEGTDVNLERWTDGAPPLLLASEFGHFETVELLLQHRLLKPNETNVKGQSSLYMASRNGLTAIVKLLLQYGVDKDLRGCDGKNALDIAKERRKYEAVRLLSNESPMCTGAVSGNRKRKPKKGHFYS